MADHDQPLPDAYPPNPNPTRWQLRRWRATAPLLVIVPMVVAGCILLFLIMLLMLHATAVPDIHVDSGSSLSLSHEVNTTSKFHGDFIFRIKNRSPLVSVKHIHVKLNIYYNHNLVSSNLPINTFIVGRHKEVTFTSSINSTGGLRIARRSKSVVVGVEFEAKRRLGIIGKWWVFAFTLYASCDDMVFEASSHGRKWTPSGDNECSIDSFYDYI